MIVIIDYSVGNLRSAQKGFEHAGVADVRVSGDREVIEAADGLVLPGVGAYRDAIGRLRATGLVDTIEAKVAGGTPLLGICLGMQLLVDKSYENGEWQGLGMIPGTCDAIDPSLGVKVPHMGWNTVTYPRQSRLFEGVPESSAFYFVHSYHCVPADPRDAIGTVHYGEQLVCAIERDNVFGVQFHPEKSSALGLRLLSNFDRIVHDTPARDTTARG